MNSFYGFRDWSNRVSPLGDLLYGPKIHNPIAYIVVPTDMDNTKILKLIGKFSKTLFKQHGKKIVAAAFVHEPNSPCKCMCFLFL